MSDCPTCASSQYARRIYAQKQANFWEYACPFQFASGAATFGTGCGSGSVLSESSRCCGSASESAEKDKTLPANLRYTEPLSYAAYKRHVTAQDLDSSNGKFGGHNLAPVVGDTDCLNCQPCTIEPSSGPAKFGAGCGPQPAPVRRMAPNVVVFRPASSLPVLNAYQWSSPESLYAFDSEEEYREAYNALYNGQMPLKTRFRFQSPQEQQRIWYGLAADNIGQQQAKDTRVQCTECGQVPIPYYRNYLESRYACACNQNKCQK